MWHAAAEEAWVALERKEFGDFFDEAKPRLVGQAYLFTGNIQDAQDAAQEALFRAWRDWDRVARLEDPHAWVRRVMHNLLVSRWRRARTRRVRSGAWRPNDGNPTDVGHLDVITALGHLPVNQQRAIVLRTIVGLSAAEVAAELGTSEGTVRVWLARGRARLAAELHLHLDRSGEGSVHETER
jgi:RNA polymerase sigma-70 factor (ECF subfamily)